LEAVDQPRYRLEQLMSRISLFNYDDGLCMEPTFSDRAHGSRSSESLRPTDPAGAETLEIMQAAPRYNRWQYSRVAPFLGRRICEVGSGIGNMSALLLNGAPELLVLTDTDPYYRDALQHQFLGRQDVVIEELTLPDSTARTRFQEFALDTVVALNVIEHVARDVEALRSIKSMLRPQGRAVVLVPALEGLFGSLDRALGHQRRYTRHSIAERMRQAGFRVERVFYFNLLGTFGWWLNARLRKVSRIPLTQLRSFDRLVPILRTEDLMPLPLPFGQSVIVVGAVDG
jgi:SAM-dependent methyltransferase